jgi:hypothetical protein
MIRPPRHYRKFSGIPALGFIYMKQNKNVTTMVCVECKLEK